MRCCRCHCHTARRDWPRSKQESVWLKPRRRRTQKRKKNSCETKMNLLNRVIQGVAEVSMVKLMLQIAAEMLNCMMPPQRDNEHLDKCCDPVAQHKLKVSMVKRLLQSTAEANVLTQVLRSTVIVSR